MSTLDLTKLTDEELRRLQEGNPPINSDASNMANAVPNAILEEWQRRNRERLRREGR